MINPDLVQKSMTKIVSFEKKRSLFWLAKFLSIIACLLALLLVCFWFLTKDLLEKGTLDLLTLFQQDPEIIIDYWKDTLETFFTEIPPDLLFTIFIAFIGFIGFIVLFQSHLRLTLSRLKSMKLFPPTSRIEE